MSVAFKEWAVVCEALGSGQQSLIIRKGGIAEGRDGFAFRHSEFLLFPTWFHLQTQHTRRREDFPVPPEPGDTVLIRYAAALEWSRWIADLDRLRGLREWHIWNDDVVEERFHNESAGGSGAHVALVRIFRLEPPLELRMEKRYGGCRSWVELPELPGTAMVSVISDERHTEIKTAIETILDS